MVAHDENVTSLGHLLEAGDNEIADVVLKLSTDERAQAARVGLCETIAEGLGEVGRFLWLSGSSVGPDRALGKSPFDFGKDDTVGLATVTQIGGELARGAITLLSDGNSYGGSALARQLVEVQYLAAAFAEHDEIAAEWLRADRDERRNFWTPGKLRKRTNGRFLSSDYWQHCDRGGHPTRDALSLLPDHQPLPAGILWLDLIGHLRGVWASIVKALEVRSLDLPAELSGAVPRVEAAVERWLAADRLSALLSRLFEEGQPRTG